MNEEPNLSELPKNWVWTNLKNITLTLQSGGTPKTTKNEYYEKGTIPFVKIEDMGKTEKYLSKTKSFITQKGLENSSSWLIPENSLLYLMYGSYGIPIINKIPVSTNQAILGIRFPKDYILLDYVYYYLVHLKPKLKNKLRGTTQLNLNKKIVSEFAIPVSSFPEQQRIVTKLEELFTKLDAGVVSLGNVKAQLQRYRQAVLKYTFEGKLTEEWRKTHKDEIGSVSVFLERIKEREKSEKRKNKETPSMDVTDLPELPENWMWVRLGTFSELITKGESPRWQGFDYVDKGIPFIRSQNVLWGKIELSNIIKIPVEFHNKLKRSHIKPLDVLVNLVGATIGRCGVVPKSLESANVNQAVALIRTNPLLEPFYLMYVLISPGVQNFIHSKKVETARPNISLTDLRNLLVPISPIEEQHKIVEKIGWCFSIIEQGEKIIKQNLFNSEKLRQSILKRAFEGKLVPQDPSDEPVETFLKRIREEKHNNQEKVMRGRDSKKKQRRLKGYVK